MKSLAIRAAEGGLLFMTLCVVSGFIAAFALSVIYSQSTGNAPPLTNAIEVKVFEPGTGFDVADYCKHARRVYIDNSPAAHEALNVKRVAENVKDADYIEWKDDNQNTSATRYFVNKQGKNDHELVQVLTSDATGCMRTQR